MGFKNVKKDNWNTGNRGKERDLVEEARKAQQAKLTAAQIEMGRFKRSPEGRAKLKKDRAARKQKGQVFKPVYGHKPALVTRNPQRAPRKSGKTPKIIPSNPTSAVSTSPTVDEFLLLRNIVNKLNSGIALSDQDIVRLGHIDPWRASTFINTNRLPGDVADRLLSELVDAREIKRITRSARQAKGSATDPFRVQSSRRILERRRARFESGEDSFDVARARQLKEETWRDQIFNRNRRKISPMSPARPFTIEAADEELAFFRRDVGFIRGAKRVYLSRVARQLADLQEELNFIDDNFNINFLNNPEGPAETRILEIGRRRRYLERQLMSRTTMVEINPLYAQHVRAAARQPYESFLDEISQVGGGAREDYAGVGRVLFDQQQAVTSGLEVSWDYSVTPADELTRVSVAEGRTRLLSDFADFPYSPVAPNRSKLQVAYGLTPGQFPPFYTNHRRKQPNYPRRVGIKVGQTVRDDRRQRKNDLSFEKKANERNMKKRALEQERKDAQKAANLARKNKPFNLSPEYMARYDQLIQPPPEAAQRVASAVDARMGSSVAERLADDTMRAASVVHSSKLGFAAVGTAALGAAFGITSLRNRNEQRRRELERG